MSQVSEVTVSTRENFRETREFGRGEDLLCSPIGDSVDLFAIRLKVKAFFSPFNFMLLNIHASFYTSSVSAFALFFANLKYLFIIVMSFFSCHHFTNLFP